MIRTSKPQRGLRVPAVTTARATHKPLRRLRQLLGGLCWWLAAATVAACSLDNREGPNVTCAQLECGRINACKNGIIAQCVDGNTVRFHVCKTNGDDVCNEDWQTFGQYRCSEYETECEGCRPERVDGCDAFGG